MLFISYVSDCKVSQELKEMKETVTSVQASLITSVSLIQGRYHYISVIKIAASIFSDNTVLHIV